MFGKVKKSSAAQRLFEEKLYERVLKEMSQGIRRDGLWAKAIANSEGREEKAKALYIQYRVQSIKDEIEVTEELAAQKAKEKAAENSSSEASQYKEYVNRRWKSGKHHWSDDHRSHSKTTTCSKCGDIHHGEGFLHCAGCGANLFN